jgi:hypothetical protein
MIHKNDKNQMKRRNELMRILVKQFEKGSITYPFNANPNTFKSLADIPVPEEPNLLERLENRGNILMKQSPDDGDFLVKQPIPKCGAFCYLVIVSRPSEK